MFNWFDLMRQAQASGGLDMLTQQFRLSDDQLQKAMLAVLPAFAMGLQHAMTHAPTNPALSMLAGSAYQHFWQAAGRGFSPQAQSDGQRLLDYLFGSDEASRRVAHQAADYTGMSVDIMQQMLPLLAGIMAGGMHHWMISQGQLFASSPDERSAGTKSSIGTDPWTAFWTGSVHGAPASDKAGSPYEDMMRIFFPAAAPSSPAANATDAFPWKDMMEQGQEMQQQYLASLQSILNDAWKNGDKQ